MSSPNEVEVTSFMREACRSYLSCMKSRPVYLLVKREVTGRNMCVPSLETLRPTSVGVVDTGCRPTPPSPPDPSSAAPLSARPRDAPRQSRRPRTGSQLWHLRARRLLSRRASNRFLRGAFPDLPTSPHPD